MSERAPPPFSHSEYVRYMERRTEAATLGLLSGALVVSGYVLAGRGVTVEASGEWFTVDLVGPPILIGISVVLAGASVARFAEEADTQARMVRKYAEGKVVAQTAFVGVFGKAVLKLLQEAQTDG